jgi:hypothetical protein
MKNIKTFYLETIGHETGWSLYIEIGAINNVLLID